MYKHRKLLNVRLARIKNYRDTDMHTHIIPSTIHILVHHRLYWHTIGSYMRGSSIEKWAIRDFEESFRDITAERCGWAMSKRSIRERLQAAALIFSSCGATAKLTSILQGGANNFFSHCLYTPRFIQYFKTRPGKRFRSRDCESLSDVISLVSARDKYSHAFLHRYIRKNVTNRENIRTVYFCRRLFDDRFVNIRSFGSSI